jgi:hypothetical protein
MDGKGSFLVCRQAGDAVGSIIISPHEPLPSVPVVPETPADDSDPVAPPEKVPFLSLPPMRYPNEYVWLLFVSGLDLMLTWLILEGLDGEEANPVAQFIIESWRGEPANPFDNSVLGLFGLYGLIVFKFCLILFVMLVCEMLGRRNDAGGRRLVRFGVGLSAIPMIVSFYLLVTEVMSL